MRLGAVLALIIAGQCGVGCGKEQASRPRSGIVSLGPNITETIFALGEGHRVVGVTTYCDYPPEALALPKVGAYFNTDLEKITLLAPQMIILQGNPPEVEQLAAKIGIQVVHTNMDSLASIDEGIATIGKALGCEAKATELRDRIKAELETVRTTGAGLARPKVLVINSRQEHTLNSLFTIGSKSFLSELIAIAGGDNVFADESSAYFEASKETIVVKAPDVIIEFHAGENLSPDEQTRYLNDWRQLSSLPAVKNSRVHLFMDSYGLRPGPRVMLIARDFARIIHPEAKELAQ